MYEQQTTNDTTTTEDFDTQTGPKTGPLDGVKNWFNGWNDRRKNQSHLPRTDQRGREKTYEKDDRSAIEKMRDKVAEFDEDYKGVGERLLGVFMQIVGYLGPFALVFWIGSDLGKYYAPVMDPFRRMAWPTRWNVS